MSDDVKPWDLVNPNQPKAGSVVAGLRLEICKGCEFYRAATNQCRKCGCFMKLKTHLENAKCPIGKW